MQPENTPVNDNQSPEQQSASPTQPWQASAAQVSSGLQADQSGSASTSQPTANQTKTKKKKPLIIGAVIAAVIIIIGGSAGAYFGLIAPNQPDNLWKNGLNNTATAYDRLVESGQKREQAKGGTFKGNFKVETKDVVVDGTVDSKFNEKNAVVNATAGASGVRININLLAAVPEGSKNPDVYAKVSGLSGIDKLLGAEGAGAGQALAAYENQWYVADHTLFDQIEKDSAQSGLPDTTTFTKEDMKAISDAVGRVNRDYIFTTDPNKAVLTKTQNVGKEKFDNRDAYHYKVSYKKDKLKAYVDAMNTELQKTKLKSYLTDSEISQIKSGIDAIDDSKQADAWVDMDTKLIRNVRITTNEAKSETIDIGQKYNGGDEVPFALGFTSKEQNNDGTATLLVTTNMKSSDIKVKAVLDGVEDGSKLKANFDGTFTASNDEVKIDKPTDAKSILDLYSSLLGAQPSGMMAPTGSSL